MTMEVTRSYAIPVFPKRDRIRQFRNRLSGRLELGLYARLTRYGLSRDLTLAIKNPGAKIPIAVRPLEERDLSSLLDLNAGSSADQREVASRRGFVAKGPPRGYVAVDQRTDTACYVQWLFGPEDNDFIARRMKGFPRLAADQALLENAYTPPAYRGLGIMSAAMALIAEQAATIGARHVLTFVGLDNIASLKGCQRAGFNPAMLHHSLRIGLGIVRRDRFEPLADNDPRRTAKF
jgi:GNAT superfamily N-acetyltransferase